MQEWQLLPTTPAREKWRRTVLVDPEDFNSLTRSLLTGHNPCKSFQKLLPRVSHLLHQWGGIRGQGESSAGLRLEQLSSRATDEGARPRARSASAELKGTPPAVSSTMEVSVSKTGNDSELCGVGAANNCGTIEYAIEHRCSCWLLTLC